LRETATGATRERVAFLLPAALLLAAVVAVPILRVVSLSFVRVELDGRAVTSWTGLSAYGRLWVDSRWWAALRNTAVFTGASTLLDTVLGVAIALVLHRRFRGRGALRAAVLIPWALPTSVMALAWAWIFNDSFGVANDLLARLGLFGRPGAWLGEPRTAKAAMIVAEVWKTTPFVALIVLAGLQGIPEEILEAARVDGLGASARLRKIVLPLLVPSILVAAAFRAVQAFGAFDIVYVLTGGGPGGATETVSLYAFQNYFRYLDFGYGSAIATQTTIFAALLAWIVIRLARPDGKEGEAR
jgi:multiple sugar transport system permease protein